MTARLGIKMPLDPFTIIAGIVAAKLTDAGLAGVGNLTSHRRAIERVIARALKQLPSNAKALKAILLIEAARDILTEELIRLFHSNDFPDAKKLAQQLSPYLRSDVPEFEAILEKLFKNVRNELSKQFDLETTEIVRAIGGLNTSLEGIRKALAVDEHIDWVEQEVRIAATADYQRFQENTFNLIPIQLPMFHGHELISQSDLAEYIGSGGRIVIEGGPGTGKSTTLLQLAEKQLEATDELIPIVIPLTEWVVHEKDIFEYIVAKGAFGVKLRPQHIRLLALHGRLLFLLDEWNQLSTVGLKKASNLLKEVEREYPDVSIIIATRRHVQPPALSNLIDISIAPLTLELQRELATSFLGEQTEKFLLHLTQQPDLRDISRVPLYLAILLTLASEDNFPRTKEEALRCFIERYEELSDHVNPLRITFKNYHKEYLIDLSVAMMKAGSTFIQDEKARNSLSQTAVALEERGQISFKPEPMDALSVLTSHHLLVQRGVSDNISFLFQHHQFQEWFASHYVEQLMKNAFINNHPQAIQELTNEIINIPLWEEAIFFAIERMIREEDEGQASISNLIKCTLGIDPMLAAEIICRVDQQLWESVSDIVIEFVKVWHTPGRADRAARFMAMTGRTEFLEYLWPLLTNKDQQVRLSAWRLCEPFRASVLGDDCVEKIVALPDDIRRDCLSELAFDGDMQGIDIIMDAIQKEQVLEIKRCVIDGLEFRGYFEKLNEVLSFIDNEYLIDYVIRNKGKLDKRIVYPDKVYKLLEQHIKTLDSGLNRFNALFALENMSPGSAKQEMLMELEVLELDAELSSTPFPIQFMADIDPEATSTILIIKLINGEKIGWHYEEYLGKPNEAQRKGLLNCLLQPNDISFYERGVIVRLIDVPELQYLISVYLKVSRDVEGGRKRDDKEKYSRYENLRAILVVAIPDKILQAIIELAPEYSDKYYSELIEIVTRIGGEDGREKALNAAEKSADSLRKMIERWIEFSKASDEWPRSKVANIARFIGRLKDQSYFKTLCELLDWELDKARDANEFWKRYIEGGRKGKKPLELRTSYEMMYFQSFKELGYEDTADLMIQLLNEPYFAVRASLILSNISRQEDGNINEDKQLYRTDFSVVRDNRKAHLIQQQKEPHPYAILILDKLNDFLGKDDTHENRQLVQGFVAALSTMRYGNGIDLIWQVLGQYLDVYKTSYMIESLVVKGEIVDSELLADGFTQAFKVWEDENWKKHENWYLVEKWLLLFSFSNEPYKIIELIHTFLDGTLDIINSRELLHALKYSPDPVALSILIELSIINPEYKYETLWIVAVLSQDSEESLDVLLDIACDNELADKVYIKRANRELSNAVAYLYTSYPNAKDKIINLFSGPLTGSCRTLIAEIIANTGDANLINEALILLDDRDKQNVPHGIYEAVRLLAAKREPIEGSDNIFNIVPGSVDNVRETLFKMIQDDQYRTISATKLLLYIDEIRDENGRPENEPRHPCLSYGIPWPKIIEIECINAIKEN